MSGITTLMGGAAARRRREAGIKDDFPNQPNSDGGFGCYSVIILLIIIAIAHYVFHI